MNYEVQRFPKGHSLYSDAVIMHTGDDGVQRSYQSCFGQFVDEAGKVLHKTMERLDTLIPEGRYACSIYLSPSNGRPVLLLHDVPHYSFIEHHIANFPYELKGCTAHGMSIDTKTPELLSSKDAFIPFMTKMIAMNHDAVYSKYDGSKIIPGTIVCYITYKTLST